ncbi:MAG: EF-hand domain-containing protein [Elainella sp.]
MSFAEPSEFTVPSEIADLIPPERLDKIKQAFVQLDQNHDGRIDRQEYLEYLLAKEREKLNKRFDYLDQNHDGSISFEEFLIVSEPNYPLLKRFKDFDSNHNGLLSIDEALQIAEEFNFPISREWLERQITQVDYKGRKLISYNEYLGAVTRFGFQ